ncbi:hypothetical protein AAFF39_00620 [Lactococcus garvieae]
MPIINRPTSFINDQLQECTLDQRRLRDENRRLRAQLSQCEAAAEEGRLSSRFHGFTSIVQEAKAGY